MAFENTILAAMKVPAYTTDTDGNMTFYNDAAADLWGHRPEIAGRKWCGSWRLHLPDGSPLSLEDSPLALTLRQGTPVSGMEVVAERPDGIRVSYMSHPNLLRDESGQVIGAINLLIELTDRNQVDLQREKLAAIVSSSDDIIISKTLDGIITSWNAAATLILGFEESEMIGQSILRIIPPDLANEEAEILRKIGRGERINHFDTHRLTKDGRTVHLSLTVSPLRDRAGRIVGVSKVARDITERKRSEELQLLLFNELNHRVKNTLATIQAIARQSLRRSAGPKEFVDSFSGRVQALARAHDLLVRSEMKEVDVAELIQEQVILGQNDARITVSGPDVRLEPEMAVQVALLLHELANNARKHGSLSIASGVLSINWVVVMAETPKVILDWRESGMKDLRAPTEIGFGAALIAQVLEGRGGFTKSEFHSTGLFCQIHLPLSDSERRKHETLSAMRQREPIPVTGDFGRGNLTGRRILIVEDEAIIAMDVADLLNEQGMVVVGPAPTLPQALQLAHDADFDLALIDANLHGEPVDGVVAILTRLKVPFAFCSGYGRDTLPEGYQSMPLLSKPFGRDDLLAIVGELCLALD